MKKTFLSLVFMVFGLIAMAKPVDSATARRAAQCFWNNHRDRDVAAITEPMSLISSPFDGMYIFAGPNGGFVIVSADDCVQPILGYSFTSPVNKELNPEVRYWLSTYQDQIEALRQSNTEASEEVTALWATLLSGLESTEPMPLNLVPTLLSTTWDQSPYYNKFCPYDSVQNHRTVAGCVATAVAQVMKYWNHPAQGTGSHSYTHSDYGTLSVDFSTTTYNWAQMPRALGSRSTTTQDNAVATLMYHVGVAIDMDYGVEASGAQLTSFGYSYNSYPSAQGALPLFFGYDSNIQAKYRNNISDADWKGYVKTELDAARPVLYAGFDSEGGHCFVCDAYNTAETHFHFNWGWSGYYDGYYTLSALSPGGGGTGGNGTYTFNLNQQILIGVQPQGYNPTPVASSDTISYCGNNPHYTSVGTGGSSGNGPMYWGIALTPEQLTGHNYLKSAVFYVRETGNYTLKVFAGGTTSPGTLVHTQNFQCVASDTSKWKEVLLDAACPIDATQNLWITLNTSGQHPAACCIYTHDPNSDWASTNGTSWSHLQELSSSLNYSWMLKAVTSQGAPEVPPSVTISGPTRTTVGTAATFTATATAGATVTWSIPGGNPSTATGTSVTATFVTPGNYIVSATASNSSGSHTATHSLVVVTSDDPTVTDTLSYCGTRDYASSVGTGDGPMNWAIMLPSAQLTGHNYLKSVMLYVTEVGSYTLKLYTGGTTAPETMVHSQTCQFGDGDEGWREVVINTSFAIDTTQNLWIAFFTTGLGHPAAVCPYTGDANSDWVTIDGSEWSHLPALASGLDYSWLLKAVTITGNNSGTESIDEVAAATFSLYPNPATDKVNINVGEAGEVSVVDMTGRQMLQQKVATGSNTVDVSTLSNGVYFVKFGAGIQKLVINR